MPSKQVKVSGGRRKLKDADEDAALIQYETSRKPVAVIAREFGVTRQTLYTSIGRAKERREALRSQQQEGAATDLTIHDFSTGAA